MTQGYELATSDIARLYLKYRETGKLHIKIKDKLGAAKDLTGIVYTANIYATREMDGTPSSATVNANDLDQGNVYVVVPGTLSVGNHYLRFEADGVVILEIVIFVSAVWGSFSNESRWSGLIFRKNDENIYLNVISPMQALPV